jgi:neutral ceramidase
MIQVGNAKTNITIYKEGIAMLGYGMWFNVMKGVKSPLFVRTHVIRDNHKTIIFACADLCFITGYLRHGILKKLNEEFPQLDVHDKNLMLTAQHTHSGPGGYTQHFLYNLAQPGFQQEIYEFLRDKIADSIVEAFGNCKEATAELSIDQFADDIDVAFNRSVKSYNQNPEVGEKLTTKTAHLGVDRQMKMLNFRDKNGLSISSINWFAVHTTSISNDNTLLSPDNKGYAAGFLENLYGEGYVGTFAQACAGDVTPNYVWDKKKKWTRGRFEDDFESAEYNGKLQFNLAKSLVEKEGQDVGDKIDYATVYIDIADILALPEFANGFKRAFTATPALGTSFMMGTKEGPGMPRFVGAVLKVGHIIASAYERTITRLWISKRDAVIMERMYRAHDPKAIVLDAGRGRIMAAKKPQNMIVPAFADRFVKYFKVLGRQKVTLQTPWIETILPIQIFTIGSLAIAGVPSEITTIAGKRLRQTLLDTLKEKGITEVIISSITNAYAGYITTKEEYMMQAYEGGHTSFGKWTLAGYQTKFKELALEMLKPDTERNISDLMPPIYEKEEIWRGF